jgi:hypothetical protein
MAPLVAKPTDCDTSNLRAAPSISSAVLSEKGGDPALGRQAVPAQDVPLRWVLSAVGEEGLPPVAAPGWRVTVEVREDSQRYEGQSISLRRARPF